MISLDHILIGEGGIFTLETKTRSKPAQGKPEIHYDGEKISVNGFTPDRDRVVQAKAQAQWLKGFSQRTVPCDSNGKYGRDSQDVSGMERRDFEG
jgi:hypothetical protein